MGTRDTILEAAARVIEERGMANATTKEIARAAGYSEATLYKHFADKEELFAEVLRAHIPRFLPVFMSVKGSVGRGDIRDNLRRIAEASLTFYRDSIPLLGAVFSEPALLARHREAAVRHNVGPHRPVDVIADYLADEQRLGRVAADADPGAVASILLGACFHQAFLDRFIGRGADDNNATFARSVVDIIMRSL